MCDGLPVCLCVPALGSRGVGRLPVAAFGVCRLPAEEWLLPPRSGRLRSNDLRSFSSIPTPCQERESLSHKTRIAHAMGSTNQPAAAAQPPPPFPGRRGGASGSGSGCCPRPDRSQPLPLTMCSCSPLPGTTAHEAPPSQQHIPSAGLRSVNLLYSTPCHTAAGPTLCTSMLLS